MNSGNPRLAALLVADEKRAFRIIVRAVRGKTIKDAAKSLGVDRMTLHRWMKRYPELGRDCEAVRAKTEAS